MKKSFKKIRIFSTATAIAMFLTGAECEKINKIEGNVKMPPSLKQYVEEENKYNFNAYSINSNEQISNLFNTLSENNNIINNEKENINNISNNNEQQNQNNYETETIKEEENNKPTSNYTVKTGDTLWEIAQKYNTTVNKIKELNNLNTNIIKVGQILKITGEIKYNTNEITENNYKSTTNFSKYGNFIIDKMTNEDYNEYKNLQWTQVNIQGNPEDLEIDLTKTYTNQELEAFIFNLAKYDNVYLNIIGKSEQGRNIYSLSIDFKSDNIDNINKNVILSTGQIHAREFAGSVFILKQYNDLIKQAQKDPIVRKKLEYVTYHSIPICNPDGREIIINGGNSALKANANNVDLNRNFNSINAGQKANNIPLSSSIKSKPGLSHFPGYTLASESETRVIMKWLDTYIKSNKGKIYLYDYHQQGHIIYSDKPWRPISKENDIKTFQNEILKLLNKNVTSDYYQYVNEGKTYGLAGDGGTLTDYATSIADGFKINERYGRMMLNINGTDMPLIQFKDLDNYMEYYKPVNSNFISLTLEIGKGEKALGYETTARNIMQDEYYKYNYDDLLPYTADLMLGSNKLNEIKQEIELEKQKTLTKEILIETKNKVLN